MSYLNITSTTSNYNGLTKVYPMVTLIGSEEKIIYNVSSSKTINKSLKK